MSPNLTLLRVLSQYDADAAALEERVDLLVALLLLLLLLATIRPCWSKARGSLNECSQLQKLHWKCFTFFLSPPGCLSSVGSSLVWEPPQPELRKRYRVSVLSIDRSNFQSLIALNLQRFVAKESPWWLQGLVAPKNSPTQDLRKQKGPLLHHISDMNLKCRVLSNYKISD